MRTRAEAIAACLRLPGAYADYPFGDPGWTVMRHAGNARSFAHIYARQGALWINLKAEPMKAAFWRDAYPAVEPAYHMNKRHWIGVRLDGGMPDADILALIEDSYLLTRGKPGSKPKK